MDEFSQNGPSSLLDDLFGPSSDVAPLPAPVVMPPDGRFAGSFEHYIVVPESLLAEVTEQTEAEPAAFGSFAAMGPHGSFELRRSDVPTPTALTTWPGITTFFYANDRHFQPIIERMGIPIFPLKRDFLQGYERVISELGQL